MQIYNVHISPTQVKPYNKTLLNSQPMLDGDGDGARPTQNCAPPHDFDNLTTI